MNAQKNNSEKKSQGRTLTKRRIFEGALVMFNKKGIAGTTIEDILQEVSVSRRTFYNYYNSKEAILHEMKEELENSSFDVMIHKTLPNFDKLSPKTKFEVFNELITNYYLNSEYTPIHHQVISNPEVSKKLGIDPAKEYDRAVSFIESIIVDFNHSHPRKIAKIVMALMDGICFQKSMAPSEEIITDMNEIFQELKSFIALFQA